VLAATQLIREGRIFDMGRVFEDSMPLFALTPHKRKYSLFTPGAPLYGPMGSNALVWNEDYICGHLAQSGTQFDALAHMGVAVGSPSDLGNIRYYNGLTHAEIGDGHGFSKLGAEGVPPFFTPGLLLDFRGLRGRPLERSEEIGVDDIRAALARQGLEESDIRPGDALFYNTGWGELWKVDNDRFNSGTPGLSPAAGDWVVAKKVVLVGTDNWGVEAIPQPKGDLFAPNHQKFLVENGIYIIENLDFTELVEAGAWRFAFSFAPLPLKGATGSPARPFAIR
jgi:kynurenine formamidase